MSAGIDVLIAGGGASGLMAAIAAAETGAKTMLLEKMKQPGLKLLISGKGRCNITNTAELPEFLSHYGSGGNFLRQTFNRFFNTETVEFFNSLGVETAAERGGRVFPKSGKASDVLDALISKALKNKVKIITQIKAEGLAIREGRITGLKTLTHSGRTGEEVRETINARTVIIATGGASYPRSGSEGDGYNLAREAGHNIIKIRPALVPLETAGNNAKRLQGLSLRNVNASLYADGKKKTEEFGELVFTHFGLSGPIILTLSRAAVCLLDNGNKVKISIDLKPALSNEVLLARINSDLNSKGTSLYKNILKDYLPSKMIPVFINSSGIPEGKPANQLTHTQRQAMLRLFKGFDFDITGCRPLSEAVVTAGGVDLKEIDPRTMQSRLVGGLYFTGEVLDIDADTGGFNLQAAFSTGKAAGEAAAAFAVKSRSDS